MISNWILLVSVLLFNATVILAFVWLFRRESGLRARNAAAEPASVELSRATDFPTKNDIREIERRLKSVEMEWNDSYTKLKRLAGRLDRARGHDENTSQASQVAADEQADGSPGGRASRRDILRLANKSRAANAGNQ